MMDFNDIKDSVICKLENTENNKEKLQNRPTETIDDMSVTFSSVISENEDGRLTLPITNEMMEEMGINQEQLKEAALNNISDQEIRDKR